jgi:hypothetical protein
MIGSYIAQSELEHTVLELEKSTNPSFVDPDVKVTTLTDIGMLDKHIAGYDVLLVHYYCHPLIGWVLLEINRISKSKVVVWCHNNGMDDLHPLPDRLNELADSVVLSGCKDNRFRDCDVIRPIPLREYLNEAFRELSQSHRECALRFSYIGSLDGAKIHTCAQEWFSYLSDHWCFEIATLDSDHSFGRYRVRVGVTQRCELYNRFFCVAYPLRKDHYGCGELVLQELLMLGYPVIIRENKVESEITDGLLGVFIANDIEELRRSCNEISTQWKTLVDEWWIRSRHNTEIIQSRKPYLKLDSHLRYIHGKGTTQRPPLLKFSCIDIAKFSYNQDSNAGLRRILSLWKDTGRAAIARKGSPAQFVKYLSDPELWSLFSSFSNAPDAPQGGSFGINCSKLL